MIRTEMTGTKTMTKTLILLVDDEYDFSKLTALELKKLGYDVTTAVDGQEAIDLIRDNKPDLVLMDIVLKGQFDGVEAAEQIRSRFNIPVVYLTGHVDDKTLARAKITEPFGYVVKPFERRELKVAIEIALYKAKTQNQLKALTEKLRASTESFHNIVIKSPDGIIVINVNGIVQFINPMTEVFFGHKAEELLGEKFSFPIVTSETKEINIIRSNGEKGVGEMRIADIQWQSKPAYLVSIQDITDRKHAEEAIRESEQKFRDLFDGANDGILLADAENRLFYAANRKICQMLGYTQEEIMKIAVMDIHPEESLPYVIGQFEKQMRGETEIAMNLPVKRKDGSIFYADVNAKPIIISGKTYLLGMFRDITERKWAEEALRKSKEQYQTTFENTGTATVLIEGNTIISLANAEFERLSGYSKNEIEGKKSWAEFVTKEDLDKMLTQHRLRRENRETALKQYEFRFVARSGEIHSILLSIDTIQGTKRSIASLQDITDRKKADESLQQLNKDLESTVQELNRSNQEIEEFAHIIAHDLKAPLRTIGTFSDLILRDYGDRLDKQGREWIDFVIGRAKRMSKHIDSILSFSEIGYAQEVMENVNLNTLVAEAIESIAPSENIKVTVNNKLPTIVCDRTRMLQVFQNLLSNAEKYMDKSQGRIEIDCIEENYFWKFSVSDNGPGIEDKYYDKIFKAFQTLLPRDEFETTGVGLSVVKRIVEMYGGRVWVESRLGHGSTFYFTFPAQEIGISDAKLETNTAHRG